MSTLGNVFITVYFDVAYYETVCNQLDVSRSVTLNQFYMNCDILSIVWIF